MPQIFTASADTRLRAIILGIVVLVVLGMLFLGNAMTSTYATRVGWVETQPVPFSHRHHVGELGIDCRYCHTSVATSARAGLPPTHTCMTCHSQIWTGAPMLAGVRQSLAQNQSLDWQRVAMLPEYVFFRHDIHIAKGIGCSECHGRIDKMPLTYRAIPLTMQFCLDCHRNPAPHLRPREEITNMNWSEKTDPQQAAARLHDYGIRTDQLTYCNVCHR